jgi:hypothetical protein
VTSQRVASAPPTDQFPRSKLLPRQTPLFWVAEKDRYLRQLLIRDIQEATGRTLLVYFASFNDTRAQILAGDDAYFMEMIRDADGGPVDLVIETPGGATDTTEKITTLLRTLVPDLRVIVPCQAKSNGTILALVGTDILMGACSELGPADPLVMLSPTQVVPAQFLLNAQQVDPIFVQAAAYAVRQTAMLATNLLSTGMMKGRDLTDIEGLCPRVKRTLHTDRSLMPMRRSALDLMSRNFRPLTSCGSKFGYCGACTSTTWQRPVRSKFSRGRQLVIR